MRRQSPITSISREFSGRLMQNANKQQFPRHSSSSLEFWHILHHRHILPPAVSIHTWVIVLSLFIFNLYFIFSFISGSPKLYFWLLRAHLPCQKQTSLCVPLFLYLIYLIPIKLVCLILFILYIPLLFFDYITTFNHFPNFSPLLFLRVPFEAC